MKPAIYTLCAIALLLTGDVFVSLLIHEWQPNEQVAQVRNILIGFLMALALVRRAPS